MTQMGAASSSPGVRERQRSSYPFIYHQILLVSRGSKITACLSGAESFLGKRWVKMTAVANQNECNELPAEGSGIS